MNRVHRQKKKKAEERWKKKKKKAVDSWVDAKDRCENWIETMQPGKKWCVCGMKKGRAEKAKHLCICAVSANKQANIVCQQCFFLRQ